MNWHDLSYLKTGTERQKSAYSAITNSKILEILKPFNPAVVSTICIDIDTPNSDIDIICSFTEKTAFRDVLNSHVSKFDSFKFIASSSSQSATVAEFKFGGFIFEIYGDTIPVKDQNAYRHLSAMARLLQLAGEKLKTDVRNLKAGGLKSEAAFCKCLKISRDPYSEMLEISTLSEQDLVKMLVQAGYST